MIGVTTGTAFHQHPPSALTDPVGDDQLPELLRSIPYFEENNADNMIETGWWSAHVLTANMPHASQWVCQTIRSSADTSAIYGVQIAYEVNSPYGVFRRVADVFWQAWGEITVV